MWKKILFCLVSLVSLALAACNTIEGVGQDLQSAGRAIQGEAKEHQGY
jgi:predicted small secreted protein